MQLELSKTETLLREHQIESTVVVFGGTQIMPREQAEAVLRELEEKGTATVRFTDSLGPATAMEIRRLMATETYGQGTHVPCYKCGRQIFPSGPVEVEAGDAERWAKLECNSPSCPAYKQPHWYPEESLEIHGNTPIQN